MEYICDFLNDQENGRSLNSRIPLVLLIDLSQERRLYDEDLYALFSLSAENINKVKIKI